MNRPKPQNPTIHVPFERLAQLKAIGKALDLSIADAIGHMINAEIARGTVAEGLPGLEVRPEPKAGTVTLEMDGDGAVLTKADAAQLSMSIRAMLTPSKDNPFLPVPDLDLARRGTSLKLFNRKSGAEKTLALSIARELADSLARAAA